MNSGPQERVSLLPDQAQEDYKSYIETGSENSLSSLIGHIFRFHEAGGFDEQYAAKGDAVVILEDLDVDSLTLAEIIFYAEDLLEVHITDAEVQQIKTLGDLKEFISQKRGARE